MAKRIRSGNFLVYGILILLIAGLGGLGATSFGSGPRAVATVGEIEVTATEYARAVESELRRFEEGTGTRLGFAEAQSIGFDRLALARLVRDAALADETRELGLSVGDQTVRDRVLEIDVFRGASGSFDRDAYEFALNRVGQTPREFERRIRRDVASGLLSAAVSSGVEAPPVYVDRLYAFARETRDASWLRLTAEDLPEPVAAPDDETLRAFHAERRDAFVRPEARIVDYARLAPEDLVAEIEVPEDEVRALYDSRLSEFVQPPRRLAERLVFASREAAETAAERLAAGETDFDALVAERGLTLDEIDLGEVTEAELGAAGAGVFALDEPGTTGVLQSSLGPAIFRVNAILEPREIPFDEARAALRDEIALDRARREVLDRAARITDLLAGGASVADIAENTAATEGRLEWTDGSEEGIAGDPAVAGAIAALEPGALPEVVETADGGVVVLSLAEIVPAAELEFEAARAEVEALWRREAERRALRERAEAVAADLSEASAGIELTTLTGVTRADSPDGLPQDFAPELFEIDEVGGTRILEDESGVYLIRLDAVTPADTGGAEADLARQRFSAETARTLAADLLDAFTRAVLAEREVRVNQSAIEAVNAQLR